MTVANRFTLAGLACVAVSITGALLLVTDLLFANAIVVIATTALAAIACIALVVPGPLRRRTKVRRGRRNVPTAAPVRGAPRMHPGRPTT